MREIRYFFCRWPRRFTEYYEKGLETAAAATRHKQRFVCRPIKYLSSSCNWAISSAKDPDNIEVHVNNHRIIIMYWYLAPRNGTAHTRPIPGYRTWENSSFFSPQNRIMSKWSHFWEEELRWAWLNGVFPHRLFLHVFRLKIVISQNRNFWLVIIIN
jgi:hypothetical protein